MRRFVLACAAVLCSTSARAVEPFKFPPTNLPHTHERAGYPLELSPLAKPGITPNYGVGTVGGSKLFKGTGPTKDEGIFGWDYVGFGRRPGRLFLNWARGSKVYPAHNGYKTDGPHVPDVIAIHPIQRAIHGHKNGHAD
jgi:hypothetical protein